MWLLLSKSGDSFEGSVPARNVAVRRELLAQLPPADQDIAHAAISRALEGQLRHMYVSCWHANLVESAAMWAQYATLSVSMLAKERHGFGELGFVQQKQAFSLPTCLGIAIRTTCERLTSSLLPSPEEPIYVGAVSYVDFDKGVIPEGSLFYPLLHKRSSFAHEREVRAVIQRLPKGGDAAPLPRRLELTYRLTSVFWCRASIWPHKHPTGSET
jgi:hypothetical protein